MVMTLGAPDGPLDTNPILDLCVEVDGSLVGDVAPMSEAIPGLVGFAMCRGWHSWKR